VSKYKVLILASHAVQYAAPIFRMMARHPRLEILVAYCSLRGAERGLDSEFDVEFAWDVPLLEGYPWVRLEEGRITRWRHLWRLIQIGGFDAVVVYTGYKDLNFWAAAVATKVYRRAFLFGTDAQNLDSRDGSIWKPVLKQIVWPYLYRLADVVIVPSSGTAELMRSLGLDRERIVVTPYAVDNDWWLARAAEANAEAVRLAWKISVGAPVVLFCAKLQSWKRPLDALIGFSKAKVPDAHLVYAGEGPLRSKLEATAKEIGLTDRVHCIGFVNQSQLPGVYCASDLVILPSEYEPFGLVVNEAMLCGRPVAVTDRVGAARDLVQEGRTGFVFPCGDVDALAQILTETLPCRSRLRDMGVLASREMVKWSPFQNIERFVVAVELAVYRRLSVNSRRG
jgi:glycosyltransferase involved in cell wall biosynthesis